MAYGAAVVFYFATQYHVISYNSRTASITMSSVFFRPKK